MYYYKHHIGDFNHATRHLTRIERSIYRDLLDLYYDKEKMLPLDLKKISKLILVSKKEFQELQNVLDEFFVKTEHGFKNTRCDFEIEEYHKAAEIARENGKRGGRPKKPSGNQKETKAVLNENPEETERVVLANPELTQKKANQEPLTINQEPLTREEKPRATRFTLDALPDDWKFFCVRERPDLNAQKTFESFSDYWRARPGKDGTKLDWLATWRNWVRNEKSQRGFKNGNTAQEKQDRNRQAIADACAIIETRQQNLSASHGRDDDPLPEPPNDCGEDFDYV